MSRGLTASAAVLLLVAGTASLEAQTRPAGGEGGGWIAGARLTIDNVDVPNLTVDITGTIFYSTGVTFSTAFVGVDSGFGTIAPAISWGDGSTVPPYWPGGYGIPFDQTSTPTGAPGPVRAYRQQFSHVYGAEGSYPITINSHFTGGFTGGQVFTGTITTAPTPSYGTFGGVQTFVQNVQTVDLIGGAGGPNPLEVPTVGELGLMALALLCAAAGVITLRR